MNLHDKVFDRWINSRLNLEISLSKQRKQVAWEQIRREVCQPTQILQPKTDFTTLMTPIATPETIQKQIWYWLKYIISQEDSYHKAHAHSAHFYKSQSRYIGGLTLHNLELVRHRWTYAV